MKRFIPAFGVPLVLAAGLGQGDARLPATPAQALTPRAPLPSPRVTPRPNLALPYVPPPRTPGDVIPHTYMVFGLRTGPGGMAFTDRNGSVLPVPSNPQIILKPFNGYLAAPPPPASPPGYSLPRIFPLPTPQK
jgi:hypothetical protein